MDNITTAETIRSLRMKAGFTQRELAEHIGVTDKAVSKWESGRGLPDVGLMQQVAHGLGISVAELVEGAAMENGNRSGDMRKAVFYRCGTCGNIVVAAGVLHVACCGETLRQLAPADPDDAHLFTIERDGAEVFVSCDHPMTKAHHIAALVYAADDGVAMRRLYPEQECEARFTYTSPGRIFALCSDHGLFSTGIVAKA